MSLIVQKYGGTSVSDLARIKKVARKIIAAKKEGSQLVVVVSAMAGETDRLDKIAKSVNKSPNPREYDNLLASGEQVSSSLLTMAIESLGEKAISLLGYQVPIETDNTYSKAVIKRVNAKRIQGYLNKGYVVVVAGFQGVSKRGNITTFGRGGSDISAVALAATLKAKGCELYKDVPGVFTADPSIVSTARRISVISHDEMMELASMGAKIIHPRAVQIAKKYGVPLKIKETFGQEGGTMVKAKKTNLEESKIVAITCDKDEAKISIGNMPNDPALESRIFLEIAKEKIFVDMIVQSYSRKGFTDIAFTVKEKESKRVEKIIKGLTSKLMGVEVYSNPEISKISLIGDAMRIHAGTAARIFGTMARIGVRIMAITTSQLKFSLAISEKYTELVLRALHEEFGLGDKRRRLK